MGLRVNTNVGSLNAQRHLYNSTVGFQKSMERLSSGLRINRSGDDAAGLPTASVWFRWRKAPWTK
jgi:flagellin